ncbi:MAG: DEAD/DEAH box helicase family protein, partial [Candidatus Kryptonium sp.]
MSVIRARSTAGMIYEVGFKLGFLNYLGFEDKIREISQIVRQDKDRYRVLSEDCMYRDGVLFIPDIPDENIARSKRESVVKFYKDRCEYNDNNLRHLAVYSVGIWNGNMFAKQVSYNKKKKIELIAADIKQEVPIKGHYRNTDLAFISEWPGGKDITYHFYDIKFDGYKSVQLVIDTIRESKEGGVIDVYPVSYSRGINLSLGFIEKDLLSFTERFLKIVKERKKEELRVDYEIKNMLQILSYLFGYIYGMERDKLDIEFGVLYSERESLIYNLPLTKADTEVIRRYRDEIMDLYRQAKTIFGEERGIRNIDLVRESIQVAIASMRSSIKEIEEKIRKEWRKSKIIKMNQTMDDLREDVRNTIKKFYEEGPWGKVLALLHSTGAGKTTNSIEVFLNSNEKVVYIYLAPRKKLIEQVRKTIEVFLNSNDIIDGTQIKKEENKEGRVKKTIDGTEHAYAYVSSEEKRGIARLVASEILKRAGKFDKLAVLLTTQSFTLVNNNGWQSSTLKIFL